ncbi:MAG: hypothetical protein KGL12_17055 [Rhodospirillales bacterium]|nr:hypothetical protein [Rhodospirillales bacterium]
MHFDIVIRQFPDLGPDELRHWIACAWVRPDFTGPAEQDYVFHEIDVARVRLIHDLIRILETPEAMVPVVLGLLDQVYDLRGSLDALRRAVAAQPEPVRRAIAAAVMPSL